MKTLNILPKLKHFPKDFDLDLALVIFFTLLCIPFVLIPPLNETNGGKNYFGIDIEAVCMGHCEN